ncbi:transcriptional repressor [Tessaracoccus sp. SD287]|uniref:Fur family transcriptional regulator n=1 Tax=Tessaracoccus sp. SD287 TaxID=2782008 RepID=UPI001A964523|nr:transcriptional repressor [Tessaracoccus sp. SD287]MBO1032077.1 transcriptional repressor [Tessaracoccus sp. SD287]
MSTPVRQTRQRAAIRALFTNSDEFRTAQQVHTDLIDAGDKVGLATVYRTLQSMAEAAELDAVRSPEGEMTYRACSSGHHHHLICRNCGTAVEIEATAVEAWAAKVASQYGFRDAGHELEMFGLCQDC